MLLLPISAGLLSLALTTQSAPLPTIPVAQSLWLSQKATTASDLLLKLPRPKGAPSKLQTLFMANAYQQQGLNFQTKGLPAPTVDFYRQALTKLGYQERTINATQGDWGFSIVFDTPTSINLAPKDSSKKVVLVIQGTMIGPDTINLNLRCEEI
ncbi:hypothetical protein [Synechocystis sp. LKSZ1]|uniref:hypothetical protein n=1 Tax=Synechocystis sp. LKSZ1 TaxID=3144951 RepID=UPI00336C14FF